MQSIEGDLTAGEAQAVSGKIASRQRGSTLSYYALMIGIIAGGVLITIVVGMAIPGSKSYLKSGDLSWIGLAIGWLVYFIIARPILIHRFRRRMRDRGLELQFHYSLEITEDGLKCDSTAVRRIADWSAVTEVFSVSGYWVFLVQMEPWLLPTRFFPSPVGEKAFIRAALAHMSEDARKRSKEAAALAAN